MRPVAEADCDKASRGLAARLSACQLLSSCAVTFPSLSTHWLMAAPRASFLSNFKA